MEKSCITWNMCSVKGLKQLQDQQTDVTLTTISPEALCSTTSNAATAPSCRARLHIDIWPAPLPVKCSITDVSNELSIVELHPQADGNCSKIQAQWCVTPHRGTWNP